jgi:hypothetical protein
LTRPPNKAFVLLKTKVSQKAEVYSPFLWRFSSFAATAFSIKDFLTPVKLSNYYLTSP